MIEVREITDKKGQKKFFKFLIDLYRGDKCAAPNLYADEFAEFNPETNDAYRFADCRMWLAYKNGKPAGRIAAIWHKGANEKTGLKQLRFTRFDVINDFEVTKALFAKVNEWAEELGMDEIIGPIGFSDLAEEGMLIEGFDRPATYIEIYNRPYYVEHMQKMGAYKVVDWNCYRIKVPEKHDERLTRVAAMTARKNGYSLLDIADLYKHDRKKLDGYIIECLHVLDEVFADLYGTSPINEKQMKREMETIYQVLIPEFAAIVLCEGKVVAYGFIMPSMTRVLQKARGSIVPFGIIPYIRAMSNVKVADMMSVGVKKEHANTGAVAMIMDSILKGLIAKGVEWLETGPELENNRNVQNLWKNYSPELHKVRRCWGLKV